MGAIAPPEVDEVEPDDEDDARGRRRAPLPSARWSSASRSWSSRPRRRRPSRGEPSKKRRGSVLALVALLAFLVVLALLLLWAAASGEAAVLP